MNENDKELLLDAVVGGTLKDVKIAFKNHFISNDKSYFDYKLLQAALKRNDENIIHFLLYNTNCRAGNPNRVGVEETPLHLLVAMKLNNQHIIKKILSKGAFIFDKDENGHIPLLAAFKRENLTAVRALLTHSKPNCKPDDKDFILHFHIACVTNHISAAAYYLEYGVNPNNPLNLDSEEYSGMSPVQFAVEKNYYPLFQKLLCHGGNLSLKNAKGLTPLHIIYYTCSANSTKCRLKQIFEIGDQTKFINAEDSNRVSHLHLCCMLNNQDLVQVFIDNGANVNSSISSDCTINPGFTPLHFAVTNSCENVVELLLKNGADCNKKDKDGKTPLHLACTLSGPRKVQIIKILLDYKASPTVTDQQGCTPLHVEFYYANSDNKIIFDMFLSKMSEKINFTDNEGLSLFHIACAINDINRVQDFLDSGVKVDSYVLSGMYSGYTGLHFAVLHNQKYVVKLLLKKNAQVNIKTKEFQVTPLHLACEFNYAKFRGNYPNQKLDTFEYFPIDSDSASNRRNQLDIIRLLFSHGALVDAKDYQGITPLLHTCMIDKNYCKLKWSCSSCSSKFKRGVNKEISIRIKEIIEMFCFNKAQMNVYTNREESILHIISKYSSLPSGELIKSILTENININAVDDAGLTPLHVAVKAKNKEMVGILLKNNANVNIKCKNSKVPLHCLFSANRWDPVQPMDNNERKIFCSLLENGSDVNILVGEKNNTLLHAAINKRHNFIIEKLLCNGANINTEDSLGNSCVSPLLEWKNMDSEDQWSQLEFAEAFQILYIHVQKLLALGLHVSKKVQKCCLELYEYHEAALSRYFHPGYHRFTNLINLSNIFLNCSKELEKLKLRKIDSHTSLYSILLKDEHKLCNLVKNDRFVKIIEDQKENKDFPLYNDLLKLQVRRGVIRSTLLPTAKETIFSITNIFGINLPDLCCDMIVKHLKNEDFANLKAAASPKMSLKRKLNDSESSTPLSSKRKRNIEK